MSYSLEFHQERVLPYLRNLRGLSRTARVSLFTILNSALRDSADFYLNDPTRRLAPNSEYFAFDIIVWDRHGDGHAHQFWFIVSDAAAKYGVMRIDYVEEGGPGPIPQSIQ